MASQWRPPFDPRPPLEALCAHGVEFVLVGGVAARLHGAPLLTQDIDLLPDPELPNRARLAKAITSLEPREIVPFRRRPVATTVMPDHFLTELFRSYLTPWGRLDVLRQLPGVGAYADVRARAIPYSLWGLTLHAASLDDVIRAKEHAGRDKDRADLARLYVLRDVLAGRSPLADGSADLPSDPDPP